MIEQMLKNQTIKVRNIQTYYTGTTIIMLHFHLKSSFGTKVGSPANLKNLDFHLPVYQERLPWSLKMLGLYYIAFIR